MVQRQGPVLFTVGGDDGYRLKIDGEEIISQWDFHPYRETSQMVKLEPGIYDLALDYFEWTGVARLSFKTDSEVVIQNRQRRTPMAHRGAVLRWLRASA